MSEFDVNKAIDAAYSEALKVSMRKLDVFLKKYKDAMDGSYPPPDYYIMSGREKFWLDGFVNALMREHEVIDRLIEASAQARGQNAQTIMRHLQNEYGHGRLAEIDIITSGCKPFGITPTFTLMDEKAVRAAVDDSTQNAPMSKIKVIDQYVNGEFVRTYVDTRSNDKLRRKLQQQLGAAIAAGDGQRKLIGRIRNVFGVEASNAKRIAQTEGNRVYNQARYETDQEAEEMGIETEREWVCRFENSRDGHMEMDGQVETEDGIWLVPWQSGKHGGVDAMRYPGDPSADAANVINCHCGVISRVKTDSPAMARLRAENAAKREAWKA